MANRRTIKHNINRICEELFAECIAASLYSAEVERENVEAMLHSIIKMGGDYTRRVSHVEPGMPAKAYFKNIIEQFNSSVNEIVDQINNLH